MGHIYPLILIEQIERGIGMRTYEEIMTDIDKINENQCQG